MKRSAADSLEMRFSGGGQRAMPVSAGLIDEMLESTRFLRGREQ
jgi:hypothetical protein